MTDIIQFFANGLGMIIDKLDDYSFQAFGFSVTLIDIFVGFIAISIIISVFWKGARG